eukprot:6171089-Pleurochrysis_carterae.AAC.2
MDFTTLRESVDVHGEMPSAPTKSGVRLGAPNVRSSSGTPDTRSSHMIHSASYAHMRSAPRRPPRCRLRSGVGVALARADVSLIGTT